MKKLPLVFTAMVLSLSLAAFGQSSPDTQSGQGEHHGRGQGRQGMNADAQLEHMSRALNLTDDQKAKIKPILEDQSNKMHQLMQDTSVSQQDKRSKFQQIHQDTMSQIKPILTSDQQQKLESMHERGGEGHSQHGQGSQPNPQ
jgi:Spy/CpxP family protein refolding chaperone